jgi:hypothetical protein
MSSYLTSLFNALIQLLIKVLDIAHHTIRTVKRWLTALLEKFKIIHLVTWSKQYNPSQLCYFSAMILLIINIFIEGDYQIWIGLLAFIGLLRELFNIFHRVWDTTLGKGFIVITYASTANFALAFAALKINAITGVEPMPFIFTLGFTTLMLMPFWIALSSVIVFMLVLVLANLWLLLSLLLKVIGINLKVHWEDKKRAVLTMLLRIILIPIVLVNLVAIMLPFANTNFTDGPINLKFTPDSSETFVVTQGGDDPELREQQEEAEEMIEALLDTQVLVESAIANFIFYLEAYPNSACQKGKDQRSVIIDENMLLLISKNESAVHGFDYEVVRCIPRLSLSEQDISKKGVSEE